MTRCNNIKQTFTSFPTLFNSFQQGLTVTANTDKGVPMETENETIKKGFKIFAKFFHNFGVREEHLHRVEVLEKVKGLLLLPNTDYATTKQVADFYEVGESVVKELVRYHSEEFISDGYKAVTGEELKEVKAQTGNLSTLKFHARLALFPRRAILRVGMLLRDSEIADE